MPHLDVKDPAERLELAYLYADGNRVEIVNLAYVASVIRARCAMVHIGDLELLQDNLLLAHRTGHVRSVHPSVRVGTVIDFPDGCGSQWTKKKEASFAAISQAAGFDVSADVVINLRDVKEHNTDFIIAELRAVTEHLLEVKAIIQLPYLWRYHKEDIGWLLELLAENKIFCVKDWTTRSDNFLKPVAVDDDTRLRYLEYVADYIAKHNLGLLKKIAGRVTADNAKRFIDAGSDLLGVSYGKAWAVREALLGVS